MHIAQCALHIQVGPQLLMRISVELDFEYQHWNEFLNGGNDWQVGAL